LYYALQTIPYFLGSSGTILDQLELMRLLSALMAAATALFAYLFLREALPTTPWAATIGGLSTALAPLLGFIGGAVNPDAMLAAVSAALFYLLARAFRRGLTPKLAAAIGTTTAIGLLTKLNFIGLIPGTLLALTLLTHRNTKTAQTKKAAYTPLAIALAITATPILTYALINTLTHHPTLGLLSRGVANTRQHRGSLGGELAYIWQSYLPRLPGMHDYFPGISTPRQLWFNRLVGAYGWLDTHFPEWVYSLALIPAGVIAALAARELIRIRRALRNRAAELLAYAALALGLLLLIGASSYLEYPARAGAYSEPRYLLPLAVLFAAIVALAARGAGRRWGPAVGALLVALILAHDIFSQLLLVSRYYA
jgi:4-amino-4-deoxy-L-arabinose transferase-like glycosyltransferase